MSDLKIRYHVSRVIVWLMWDNFHKIQECTPHIFLLLYIQELRVPREQRKGSWAKRIWELNSVHISRQPMQ